MTREEALILEEQGELFDDEDWPPFDRQPGHFLIDQGGDTVLFNELPGRASGIMFQEAGRTVVRRRRQGQPGCNIIAFFGLGLDLRDGNGRFRKTVLRRFSSLQPELAISSNARVGVRIKVTSIGDPPGTLRIVVTRTAPNTDALQPREFSGTQAEVLAQISAQSEKDIELKPPPGMNDRDNRVVVEQIEAYAQWTPEGGRSCRIHPVEKLQVRWEFAPNITKSHMRGGPQKTAQDSQTAVSHGTTITPTRNPDGRTFLGFPIQTFYPVENAERCCGRAGTHTVIQFVRHEWNLKENPVKDGSDGWSLDVLKSEIDRANAGQPYDPTFTHNPRGTSSNSDPLTYPGPDPNGALSISQVDRPGISPELFRRFNNANPNSTFTFHFLSILVCRREPASANDYMRNGKVRMIVEYKIEIKFRERGREPEVTLHEPKKFRFSSCKKLSTIIRRLDLERRRRGEGSIRRGYRSPRGHTVAIPAQ
ncbi:hypothetical protein [Sulfitobacter sp. MF3-043]|uniref:hypothetical protein n=1 Tax=Sulfitobacter sediminivivens TaxID=3252902 RepID=UPI0036DC47A4